MAAVPMPLMQDEQGRLLGTLIHIAEDLGVGVTAVWQWVQRRPSTGFPEPVARRGTYGRKDADWFDLAEVREWRDRWQPTRGGVPTFTDEATGRRLGSAREVADLLDVPVKRVHTWMERQATNGCPGSAGECKVGTRTTKVYDLDEWATWFHASGAAARRRNHAA